MPRSYAYRKPNAAVLFLAGKTPQVGRRDIAHWFGEAWGDEDTRLVVAPERALRERFDLLSSRGLKAAQNRRQLMREVIGQLNAVRDQFNIDPRRVVLDCGRGHTEFGLRLACRYPDRFSGIILREPITPNPNLLLGSLHGKRVLVLRGLLERFLWDELLERLKRANAQAQIEDRGDTYPFPGAARTVRSWAKASVRERPQRIVVLEPNEPGRVRNQFVEITHYDLSTRDERSRPFLKVSRARVEAGKSAGPAFFVEARNVSGFRIFVNDEDGSLDKPVSVSLESETQPQRQRVRRDIAFLVNELASSRDADRLYVASISFGRASEASSSAVAAKPQKATVANYRPRLEPEHSPPPKRRRAEQSRSREESKPLPYADMGHGMRREPRKPVKEPEAAKHAATTPNPLTAEDEMGASTFLQTLLWIGLALLLVLGLTGLGMATLARRGQRASSHSPRTL